MECKVVFSDSSLKKSFEELSKTDSRLLKEIEKALNDICQDHSVGRNVKKKLIPKSLIKKSMELTIYGFIILERIGDFSIQLVEIK